MIVVQTFSSTDLSSKGGKLLMHFGPSSSS
jgi:hypothetical protein